MELESESGREIVMAPIIRLGSLALVYKTSDTYHKYKDTHLMSNPSTYLISYLPSSGDLG